MIKSAFLFLILFTASIPAQKGKSFPQITNDNLADAVVSKPEYYEGEALWGLINGGADLYLEYGFDELLFQKVEWKGFNFRIEIYRMNSPEAAFGIFSLLRHKCVKEDTLTKFICVTKFQTQAAFGKYYFSLSNDKGNEEVQNLTVNLFAILLSQIEEPTFELPEIYRNVLFENQTNKIKFISGEIALQNGFAKWYDLLGDYSGYKFFVLPLKDNDLFMNLAVIDFDTEEEADKFINKNSYCDVDVSRVVKPIDLKKIIFIETNFPEEEYSKFLE